MTPRHPGADVTDVNFIEDVASPYSIRVFDGSGQLARMYNRGQQYTGSDQKE